MRLASPADLVSKHTWAYARRIIKGLRPILFRVWGYAGPDDLLFDRQKTGLLVF